MRHVLSADDTSRGCRRKLAEADGSNISPIPLWFLAFWGDFLCISSIFSIAHLPPKKITNAASWIKIQQ